MGKQLNNLSQLITAFGTFKLQYDEFQKKFSEYSEGLNLDTLINLSEKQFKQQSEDFENKKNGLEDTQANYKESIRKKTGNLGLKRGELDKLINGQNESIKQLEKEKKILEEWKKKKAELEEELQELKNKQDTQQIKKRVESLYSERFEISKQIYNVIQKNIKDLQILLNPLNEVIKDNSNILEDKVKLDISIRLSNIENIFKFTNNQRGGFRSDDQNKKIDNLSNRKLEDWNNIEELIKHLLGTDFLKLFQDENSIQLDKLKENLRDKENNSIKSLYDYIFGLEYLEPFYQIKYEDKTLDKLSAGERGALLLTFYLLLDTNEYPIIIDQPEANLDNDSIVTKLKPLIEQAKRNRQVIIVTHNPNIALCCDAEQIIYCEHSSDQSCKSIKYTSGAIESKEINDKLLKILEGGRTAFNHRDKAYLKY